MQEQNKPSVESTPEKVPLEKQGHLSRTQLYILLAILSVAVLGLCAYIVWDCYNSDPVITKTVYKESTETQETEDDTENTDEDTETETDEELNTLSFEYVNNEDPEIYRKFSIDVLVPEGTAIVDSCPDTDTTTDFNPIFVQGPDFCLKFHSGLWMFAPRYDSVEQVATSSQFGEISRITLPDRPNSYYTNNLSETETCNALMEKVDPPCGFPTLDNEELDSKTTMLIVECLDVSESQESCDSIVESLEYSVTDSE